MGQQALNGVFVGSIYALFAVGYTLVFGVLDILNLAHQAVFMLAAFAALWLVGEAHLSLWVALPAAVALAGLAGLLLERVAFRPLRGRADSNISGLISSLAMATVFEAIALQLFGPDTSRFPLGTFPDRVVRIGGASASLLQLCIVAVAVALMALLTLLIARTRLGRRLRAVAESPRAARILGIDVDRAIAAAFFLSSALGGAAGVLFGLAFNSISPDVGRSVELKGLAVIILGGMGSVTGAVVAGFALGLIEVFTVARFGSSFRDAVSFAVLFLVLLARPRGLFGQAAAREA
ncbi:MAG TPA: branched-chain amino acid ABC transporter permease [Myxococcales bacterium]|jgi:branched-chain amino acid transport system permease protein|nr:branched-chain amino acid ABC transporter permease [Myxococcales bacterium]